MTDNLNLVIIISSREAAENNFSVMIECILHVVKTEYIYFSEKITIGSQRFGGPIRAEIKCK